MRSYDWRDEYREGDEVLVSAPMLEQGRLLAVVELGGTACDARTRDGGPSHEHVLVRNPAYGRFWVHKPDQIEHADPILGAVRREKMRK